MRVAASPASARELLARVDRYVRNQSRFDRQSRVNIPRSALKVTRKKYLQYLMTQARAWSDAEVGALTQIIDGVRGRLQRLDVTLPTTVYLVKTTGEEEGFAAYTRGRDTIVLPQTKVDTLWSGGGGGDALHPTPDVAALENIITHEFFHLISKNNSKHRRALYKQVHYKQFDPPIQLPDAPWADSTMAKLKITNPDTPELNVFIRMTPPGADGPIPLMPVLLSKQKYAGGVFFDDLEWWFMAIRRRGPEWVPVVDDDKLPVMIEASVMMDQYMELIGGNITQEIFHPDEILAQNFVLAVSQPDLKLLRSMKKELERDD